jgi:hypothetical protein
MYFRATPAKSPISTSSSFSIMATDSLLPLHFGEKLPFVTDKAAKARALASVFRKLEERPQ